MGVHFMNKFPALENFPDSHLLSDKQAAAVLGLAPNTLAVWRCTGRYNLPYVKAGRLVRYQAADLREFIQRRTASHTGGAA